MDMNRDKDLQRVFEIADDSLQGVLGHYLYVLAVQSACDFEKVPAFLPSKVFPMTFSWDRMYNKQDLIEAFKQPVFEIYQGRLSLLSIVTIFDVALNGFIETLNARGFSQKLANHKLRQCIIWAYDQLVPCDIGDTKAVKRIPKTFGIIDNARRLRNLIVHNQGLFNERYEKQVITERPFIVDMHPHYSFFKANPQKPTPVLLDKNSFMYFSRAHLELLHLLHNRLQKKYFGYQIAYDYLTERKRIEWTKALWGKANVKIQPIKDLNQSQA
jgi:hypothetical protein